MGVHPVLAVAARMGQGSDSRLAHVAHGDVVVPHEIISPDVHAGLQKLFAAKAKNKGQFTVGDPANKINPRTGLAGFDGGENSGTEGPGGGDNTDPGGNGTSGGDTPAGDNGVSGDPTDVTGAVAGDNGVPGNIGTNTTVGDQIGYANTDDVPGGGVHNAAGALIGDAPPGLGFTPAGAIDYGGGPAEASKAGPTGIGFIDDILENPGKAIATLGFNTVFGLLTGGLGVVPGLINTGLGIAHDANISPIGNFGQTMYGAIQSHPGTPGDIGGGGEGGPGDTGLIDQASLSGTGFNQSVGQSVGTPVMQSSSPAAAAAPQSNFGTGIDDIVRRAGLA